MRHAHIGETGLPQAAASWMLAPCLRLSRQERLAGGSPAQRLPTPPPTHRRDLSVLRAMVCR